MLAQLLCEPKKTERTKICVYEVVLFVDKTLKFFQFFRQSFRKLLLRNHIFNQR